MGSSTDTKYKNAPQSLLDSILRGREFSAAGAYIELIHSETGHNEKQFDALIKDMSRYPEFVQDIIPHILELCEGCHDWYTLSEVTKSQWDMACKKWYGKVDETMEYIVSEPLRWTESKAKLHKEFPDREMVWEEIKDCESEVEAYDILDGMIIWLKPKG